MVREVLEIDLAPLHNITTSQHRLDFAMCTRVTMTNTAYKVRLTVSQKLNRAAGGNHAMEAFSFFFFHP